MYSSPLERVLCAKYIGYPDYSIIFLPFGTRQQNSDKIFISNFYAHKIFEMFLKVYNIIQNKPKILSS